MKHELLVADLAPDECAGQDSRGAWCQTTQLPLSGRVDIAGSRGKRKRAPFFLLFSPPRHDDRTLRREYIQRTLRPPALGGEALDCPQCIYRNFFTARDQLAGLHPQILLIRQDDEVVDHSSSRLNYRPCNSRRKARSSLEVGRRLSGALRRDVCSSGFAGLYSANFISISPPLLIEVTA